MNSAKLYYLVIFSVFLNTMAFSIVKLHWGFLFSIRIRKAFFV